jgi:hypothetical protein
MFTKPKDNVRLETEIENLYKQLEVLNPEGENYPKVVDQLVKLEILKANTKAPKISPDVLATIIANLVGIGIIVRHEQLNVIASKALAFVTKLK